MSTPALLRTPLYNLHLELGARMVAFAGYEMPVQYPPGIIREHLHARSQAALFDVSHMGQLRLHGAGAAAALERLVPGDILGLAQGRQRYTFLTNEQGGVLDDIMVANAGEHLFLVLNASRKRSDIAHMREVIGAQCGFEMLDDRAFLALQGPAAARVMQRLCPAAAARAFMSAGPAKLEGAECFVSRSGYTGEDGFEISVPGPDVQRIARLLLAQPEVAPAGLGARDSLRLEAGLTLYGHDIDETTTPVEAGHGWAIGKARRSGGARAGGFPGAERILREMQDGTARKLVGLRPEGRAPIREGETLFDALGRAAGRVTSGGFGPTLDGPIALAYVESSQASPGGELQAVVRGKPRACRVAGLPFVPHRYFRGGSAA